MFSAFHCLPFNFYNRFSPQPEVGDPVSVGFSAVGEADVQLTAQVSASYPMDATRLSEVRVLLRNVGGGAQSTLPMARCGWW